MMDKMKKEFLVYWLPIWVIVFGTSFFAGKLLKEWEPSQLKPFRFQRETAIVQVSKPSWKLASPAASAEYIDGPIAANIGELCIFRLNDTATKADWSIIPQSPFYVDTGKNSICFASNTPARYTIIAAIVENNEPKILLHFCDYGGAIPNPSPGPNPTPLPKPETLTEWVKENKPSVPDTATAALASCYQSAAEGIEKGAFKTQTSAYSALRTATQTKIKPELWGEFLDKLETQITEKLAGSSDTKKLGELFREVATGLNVTPSITETVDIPIIGSAKPSPVSADCSTGTCPPPTTNFRRR
ncbi:MAG: hypothetical protein ACRC2T_00300 [Thermoguttaceae bacterium]